MLSTLITSKTRVDLITWFVIHPGERFHYNQLLRIFDVSPTSIQKELKKLEAVGVLQSQKEAHIRFYSVNKDFVLYPEIKSMILKTVGVGEELRKSLSEIGDIKSAFIHGSVAKTWKTPAPTSMSWLLATSLKMLSMKRLSKQKSGWAGK